MIPTLKHCVGCMIYQIIELFNIARFWNHLDIFGLTIEEGCKVHIICIFFKNSNIYFLVFKAPLSFMGTKILII